VLEASEGSPADGDHEFPVTGINRQWLHAECLDVVRPHGVELINGWDPGAHQLNPLLGELCRVQPVHMGIIE
jgi:hypothetical protein